MRLKRIWRKGSRKAKRRSAGRYGPNSLGEHPRRSLWDILISQFKSLIIALLAAAAGVAFLFGETLEGWAVIVINTAIGFFTELRAERASAGAVFWRTSTEPRIAAV